MANRDEFENYYRNILMTLPSFHDLVNENSYHVVFLGMCAWLANDYEIISNKETGKGRCDIILKAKKSILPSYIFEFKYTRNKEQIEQLSNQAIQQIIDNNYDVQLAENTIYIGLAHCGKDVSITWENKSKNK
ncbi:PD-(D/E)XK nuclease domain-containing protein [Allocoprobacillus halotolerans]|uniref:PD-(D/E)XK nuclease domain-containing protein n=1 Tax=Allocoprobacillus halotolerans TaxID=2944914 RepID=A0ABY5I5N0_9FIRM|nr:PD-(D/E)XK nuclease domain-containing protein [Allocoprobacillus halotolerans]UTY39257.1 PD-(D/E)XK nuclease domain-containing protein [Allocoprobacillus halotolerans]